MSYPNYIYYNSDKTYICSADKYLSYLYIKKINQCYINFFKYELLNDDTIYPK